MNKNKLIFATIGLFIVLGTILIIMNLNSTDPKKSPTVQNDAFNIWILGDSGVSFGEVIKNFKVQNQEFETKNIVVTAFGSKDEYNAALTTSIISKNAPDIFVLQNNEKNSIFENQTAILDPTVFSANDFRAKFKGIFGKDLIINGPETEDKKIPEFIKGLPVGYETLGIFLNRTKGIKVADLDSITGMNNAITQLANTGKNIIPLGLGNGSTVYDVADIITQFLMNSSGVSSLGELGPTDIKDGFNAYLYYGDVKANNRYDDRFVEMKNFQRNNLDLFSTSDIAMVVGYPRMIEEIEKRGFRSFLLLATSFPADKTVTTGKRLARYNYFVVNKDTQQNGLATKFLSYLASDNGASTYLDNFPYYLPALLSLESDRADEKIHPNYNIILKNFYAEEGELSSFDKAIEDIYDSNIESILDNPTNYADTMGKLKNTLICKVEKIKSQENLGKNCNY